jgi:hypothetical protein
VATLGLLLLITTIFLEKTFRKRKNRVFAVSGKTASTKPDPSLEEVEAGDLPADRWLSLAKELRQKGSYRPALRAFYLATLAHLSEMELITLAKHKSDCDYRTELRRRAHEYKGLLTAFSGTIQFFHKSWYGMYEVGLKDLNQFAANQERILTLGRR